MSERFVIDNSVVMAWCFEDANSTYADAILTRLRHSEAVVPGIWPLEVGNVLLVAERKRRIGQADVIRLLELVQALPIKVGHESPQRVFGEVTSLARRTGLSAYDASYLELAMRSGLPIATQDDSLLEAAHECGVTVVGNGGWRYNQKLCMSEKSVSSW